MCYEFIDYFDCLIPHVVDLNFERIPPRINPITDISPKNHLDANFAKHQKNEWQNTKNSKTKILHAATSQCKNSKT